MDLSLFHPKNYSNRTYRIMDRLNSWTRLTGCSFLDNLGWYNLSVSSRLLGHYRLFQHYKKSSYSQNLRLPPTHTYIIHLRKTANARKYRELTLLNLLCTICFFPTPSEDIYEIDNLLITRQTEILQEFLTHADQDFTVALANAIAAIQSPDFLTGPYPSPTTINIHPAIETPPAARENLRGKQKNVFSKKQVLILFDLIAQTSSKIESIDLCKPNKFPDIAHFLHALTGKSQETWIEELKDYSSGDLYGYNTPGELNQLMSTLSNLADILRKSGLRTLASQADKKIRELDSKRT